MYGLIEIMEEIIVVKAQFVALERSKIYEHVVRDHNIKLGKICLRNDNMQAFRAAWGAACKNSTTEAKVLIPEGTYRIAQTMFAGPCNSPKPITVEVIGTVVANTNPSQYVSPEWFTFQDIDGLVLTGTGVFDGQGAAMWPLNDCKKNKNNCAPLPAVSIFLVKFTILNIVFFLFETQISRNIYV